MIGVRATVALIGLPSVVPMHGIAQVERHFALVPVLTIDSPVVDSAIAGGVFQSNGQVVLFQPQRDRIIVFDASGHQLAETPGRGEGKGEFIRLSAGGPAPDGFWAYDALRTRVTLFRLNGSVVRSVSVPTFKAAPSGSDASFDIPNGPFTYVSAIPWTGEYLVSSVVGPEASVPRTWRRPAGAVQILVNASSGGMIRNVVAWTPFVRCDTTVNVANDEPIHTRMPFCVQPIRAVGPEGHVTAIVQAIMTGRDSVDFVTTSLAPRGDTVFVSHVRARAVPVTPQARDSEVTLMGRGKTAAEIAALRQLCPASYSGLKSVVVGADGSVWIEQVAARGRRTWIVLDSSGVEWGRSTLAREIRPKFVGLATMWGIEEHLNGGSVPVHWVIHRSGQ